MRGRPQDLYAVLGVPRNANLRDIRRAYAARRSALPAESRDLEALQEAYDVLTDSELRAEYDASLPPIAMSATKRATTPPKPVPSEPTPVVRPAAPAPAEDLYTVLGVARSASLQEIERAYEAAVKASSSGRGDVSDTGSSGRPERIEEAYSVLSDPTLRAEYDEQIRNGRRASQAPASGPSSSGTGVKDVLATEQPAVPRNLRLLVLAAGAVVVVLAFVFMQAQGTPPTTTPAAPTSNQSQLPPIDQAQVAALMRKLAQNPNDAETLLALGTLYSNSDRPEEAVIWYERASEVDPKNVSALSNLGAAYFRSGRQDDAKAAWNRALAIDPNNVGLHFMLGLAYSHSNPPEVDKAIAEWEVVIRTSPQSPEAKQAQQFIDNARQGKRG